MGSLHLCHERARGERQAVNPDRRRGGRIYLASEDGDLFVVKAGRAFELLSSNPVGEPLMATPAISGNLLVVRAGTQLIGIR